MYAQHVPLMMTTVEAALKAKLKDSAYPSVGPAGGKPQEVGTALFVWGAPRRYAVSVLEWGFKRDSSDHDKLRTGYFLCCHPGLSYPHSDLQRLSPFFFYLPIHMRHR